MRKIAILQPNYLPWKGVFDLIHQVDVFVFLEDVQYTEHDWRNRNKILTDQGEKWIVVPVKHSGKGGQLICEAEIDMRSTWQKKHFNAFQTYYAKTPYFKEYKWIIEDLYMEHSWQKISELDSYATKLIAKVLGIKSEFISSLEVDAEGKKDDRVINIVKRLNGDFYLSGPAAKDYIIPKKFSDQDISLKYIDYEYPEYNQLFKPFSHYVTVLDVIFNCGLDSPFYIWGWRNK